MDEELGSIAEVTGAQRARRAGRIQALWSGYGEIVRIALEGAATDTVIAKWVDPPAAPRGDASHRRKVRSYQVETAWYRTLARRCDDACRIPQLLAAKVVGERLVMLLEDLDAVGFAERRRAPGGGELDRCLSWLAAFHARFLGVAPVGLWKTGTYWHLGTRAEELVLIDDEARREARHLDHYFAELRAAVTARGAAGAAAALEDEWRALYPIAAADYYRFLAGWAPAHWQREAHGQALVREVLRTLA